MFHLVTKWQEIQKSKLLNAKNKKHRIFQDTKFYHPAKFELKWTKKGKVVPRMHLFVSYVPTMFMFHMFGILISDEFLNIVEPSVSDSPEWQVLVGA